MDKLTRTQDRILHIIAEGIRKDGFPPSIQEITEQMGFRSKNAVAKQLHSLQEKGYIARSSLARSIKVIHPEILENIKEQVRLPLLGTIAAGTPLLAEQNIDRWIAFPKSFFPGTGALFLLRVMGDSMMGAGIIENDLVVVRSTPSVDPGDIVVALTDGEATVKRLLIKDGSYFLHAENPVYTDIPLGEDWTIQGKVMALFRENVY